MPKPDHFPLALQDNTLVPLHAVQVHLEAHAMRYALSVFEGVRAYTPAAGGQARPFALEMHLQRLQRSLSLCSLPNIDLDSLQASIEALLQACDVRTDAYIRIAASATSRGTMTAPVSVQTTATVRPMGRKRWLSEGYRLRLTVGPRKSDGSLLPHEAKCIAHYAGSFMAKSAARRAGFDDVLLRDAQGRLSEAATANLFVVRQGQLLTPATDCAILPGITRATLLRLAAAHGLKPREAHLFPEELASADEVFLCGTGSEIAPVAQIDDWLYEGDSPITRALIEAYFHEVRP